MPFLTRTIEGEIGVSGTGSTDNGVLVRDIEGELCVMPTNGASEPGIYSYVLNVTQPADIFSPAQSTWVTAQTHNLTAAEKSNLTCSKGDAFTLLERYGSVDGSFYRVETRTDEETGILSATYTRIQVYGTIDETSDQLLATLYDAGVIATANNDDEIRSDTGEQTGSGKVNPVFFGEVTAECSNAQIDYFKYQFYTINGYEIDAQIKNHYVFISRSFDSYTDIYDSL